MTFDHYVFLDKNEVSENPVNATGLVDLGDRCLLRARHDKKEACQNYRKQATGQKYSLPSDFLLELDHTSLLDPAWIAIDVSFTLESPWYSKDDRPFHGAGQSGSQGPGLRGAIHVRGLLEGAYYIIRPGFLRVALGRNNRLQTTFFRKTACRRSTISLIHQQFAPGSQQLPQPLYQLAAQSDHHAHCRAKDEKSTGNRDPRQPDESWWSILPGTYR